MSIFQFAKPSPVLAPTLPKQPSFKVFATMCVHRHIDPEAFGNILELMYCRDPKFVFSRRRGDALIDRSRSIEATRFLRDLSYDVLFFVDDDVIYDPKDAIRMCQEVKNGKDIVGGAYVLKQDGGGHFTSKLLPNNKTIEFGPNAELQEVRYVATGFMAISRKVVEEMSNVVPLCVHSESLSFHPFFQPFPYQIENGKWLYLSEDWAFVQRAANLGFKCWLDPRIKLAHAGRYKYDWDDLLRGKKEVHEAFTYTERVDG